MIEIASPDLAATLNPQGGELWSLRDAQGRELMTDADPAFWTGHAPLLFPIVGRLSGDRYRLGERDYAMKQHGFARRQAFELVSHAPDSAVFRLTDNEETRAQYPFAFALEAAYRLDGPVLHIDISIANRGEDEMPASFGFHPAFAWPLPYGQAREDHKLTFDMAEPARLSPLREGLAMPPSLPSPLDGRILPLSDALFENDALVWESIASRGLRYGADAGPALEIGFGDASKLGVWTKPGARFVCIEPWHGIADPVGYDGDFRDKPGMMRFAPGETRRFAMQVALRRAQGSKRR
ncbi:aldose 1-epimerase family protein [Stakelama tenebrarum]|uniref:aldose 1-epimerase family protein n=1 Tax=Stakelama tenebrarum TaxID=2711215 RepID=UPI001D1858A1|nr:aldose 1-epimerase family protein [Sphingosinithalassobacter tenebrarum]